MKEIAEYSIIEKIDETRGALVYRGKKSGSDHTVIAKVLKSTYPTTSEIARFMQEYTIIKNIDIDGVIKTYDIVKYNNSFALILEDFDAISLKDFLDNQKSDIKTFLEIAITLSETLGNLHKNNIIHYDIKPQNILINPGTNVVKITDFGISTLITHENDTIYNPEVIEGSLLYMSPEQTGRMNRIVDYRTDLYSLGVTFYRMLTGKIPFKSGNPLEIIHSHLARKPIPPVIEDSGIPRILSEIIMVLLNKTPEERYQNSFGLMKDLQKCREQYSDKGKIQNFELAKNDFPIKYIIPQIIVGRKKELSILAHSFENVSNGFNELLLVSGPPGIGKSALINKVQKSIISKRGYFISGKYDPFRRDVPYSSIIQAFEGFVRQMLTESEDQITDRKNQLIHALGSNGRIITDIIPDFELIIGKQPELQEVESGEAINRFNYVFKKFLKVFAAKEHPLVLFLDDLQWADIASIKLIEELISDTTIKYFLLIGAYRDNEVDESPPLLQILKKISTHKITTISLSPIEISDVNKMITNFLKCDKEKSSVLAELVYQKTGGNPFFINQFMKTLYTEKLINLEPVSGWNWDIDRISTLQVTDNIIKLLADNLLVLPEDEKDILKICSCIGNRFELELISLISNKPVEEVLSILTPVIEKGFISYVDYIYRFHHDRIHEAVYSLIPESEKSRMHYKIGTIILKSVKEKDLDKKLIFITDHLNRGIASIKDRNEKLTAAELNLRAGRKSRKATAYESASRYIKTGLELLGEDSWNKSYELSYSLYIEMMGCQFALGHYAKTEAIYKIIEENVKTAIEKTDAADFLIKTLTLSGRSSDGIKLGIDLLADLGNKDLPRNPSLVHLIIEVIKLKKGLIKKLQRIIKMPLMKDPLKIAVIKLISSIGGATINSENILGPLITVKGIGYYLKIKEISVFTPLAIMGAGLVFLAMFKEYDVVFDIFKIAFKLAERDECASSRVLINYIFATNVLHWKKHLKESIPYLTRTYRDSLEQGDKQTAGFILYEIPMLHIIAGKNLNEVINDLKAKKDSFLRIHNRELLIFYRTIKQFCLSMQGSRKNKNDAAGQEKKIIDTGNYALILLYFLYQLQIKYFRGEYAKAYTLIKTAESLTRTTGIISTTPYYPEFIFYYCLIIIALYKDSNPTEKRKYVRLLERHRKMLKKWAVSCGENYLHKYLTINAEIARLHKKYLQAEHFYDMAIHSAKENDYINNEAIANEHAALFYLDRNLHINAKSYIIEAHNKYLSWGAIEKANSIKARYTDFFKPVKTDEKNIKESSFSTGTFSDTLDLTAVIKASEVILSEINLGNLLKKIMDIAIENAGAQRGFLILKDSADKKLYIQAEAVLDIQSEVLQSIPVIERRNDLSTAIIHYVNKTKAAVVVDDAQKDKMFYTDSYITRNKPKSIMCLPIKYKGNMSGILYLENNTATHVFSADRLELLHILSTQAAISIENAYLISTRENILKKGYIESVIVLSQTIEAKDPYTRGHCLRVHNFSQAIGKKLAFDDDKLLLLGFAALLHDIGKIGISTTILNKNENLTDEEYTIIKKHPDIGADILKNVEFYNSIIPIIRHHHEAYNGKGYPDGIAGRAIPYEARILAVCDTYDAMTSDRPYRKAFSTEKALHILKEIAGSQLDPELVELFIDNEIYATGYP